MTIARVGAGLESIGQTNHILSDTSEYDAYYDVMVTINGENSSVTLINDGETYMLGDLWNNNDREKFPRRHFDQCTKSGE